MKKLLNIIRSCRPLLWLKTLWVMLLASYLVLNKLPPLKEFILGFAILGVLMWSGLYILNDLSDINVDKFHNEKKNRPIIAGKISKKTGIIMAIILISLSLVLSTLINLFFFIAVLFTLINQLTYTLKPFRFKESANWDFISCGMLGQILRFLAGWFLFTTSFNIPILALIFVTLTKTSGFLFYRLHHYDLEKKLKYKSSVITYNKNRVKILAFTLMFIAIISFFLMLLNDKFFKIQSIGILPFNLIYLTPIVILIAPFYLKIVKNPNLYTNRYIRHVSYAILTVSLLLAVPLL
ncbi:UbiA family prenyltransferase [Candidatus Woesearchaeota archaeon]|nr:UbiA family prenyltransferase [Candidatus Woesearchaeota archaeon]